MVLQCSVVCCIVVQCIVMYCIVVLCVGQARQAAARHGLPPLVPAPGQRRALPLVRSVSTCPTGEPSPRKALPLCPTRERSQIARYLPCLSKLGTASYAHGSARFRQRRSHLIGLAEHAAAQLDLDPRLRDDRACSVGRRAGAQQPPAAPRGRSSTYLGRRLLRPAVSVGEVARGHDADLRFLLVRRHRHHDRHQAKSQHGAFDLNPTARYLFTGSSLMKEGGERTKKKELVFLCPPAPLSARLLRDSELGSPPGARPSPPARAGREDPTSRTPALHLPWPHPRTHPRVAAGVNSPGATACTLEYGGGTNPRPSASR